MSNVHKECRIFTSLFSYNLFNNAVTSINSVPSLATPRIHVHSFIHAALLLYRITSDESRDSLLTRRQQLGKIRTYVLLTRKIFREVFLAESFRVIIQYLPTTYVLCVLRTRRTSSQSSYLALAPSQCLNRTKLFCSNGGNDSRRLMALLRLTSRRTLKSASKAHQPLGVYYTIHH